MMNKLTYRKISLLKWLTALLISLSCFAFSLTPGISKAHPLLPDQIECVDSSANISDREGVSYISFADTCTSKPVRISKAYQITALFAHQALIKTAFESVSSKLCCFTPSVYHHQLKVSPRHSGDLPPAIVS